VSICAVLILTGWVLWQKNLIEHPNSDHFVRDREAMERLLKNSSEIHRIWNEGEESREWILIKNSCLEYLKITADFDESLLRCNPLLLQCHALFSKKTDYNILKPESENKILYRYMTKSNTGHLGLKQPGYLFRIEDIKSHKYLDILLGDQCHEIYLQQRAYAYGEELKGKEAAQVEDYRFDNFGQNIYIDRHLVTNAEVNDWIDFGNTEFTKGLIKREGNQYFLPATHLQYSQMENYCSFKGKQVLTAHVADAAGFLPMDLDEILPVKNSRSPYFWTKKKNEFKEDCNLIYAKECLDKKPFKLNFTGPTWAGMMDPMGGVFEVFRNPIDPESNLKASSFYFNFKSPWHKLGFRAKWDGEGFDLRHFDFRGINPDLTAEKFQVGFRCMRESE
jgi:hypothetical protein